jgi:hypothetical protein
MKRLPPASALRLAGLMAVVALSGCAYPHGMSARKTMDPGPSRASPTPGTRNPNAPGPQGTLPNPHANPQ